MALIDSDKSPWVSLAGILILIALYAGFLILGRYGWCNEESIVTPNSMGPTVMSLLRVLRLALITHSRIDDGQLSQSNGESITSPARILEPSRHWRDVFWLFIFSVHLMGLGFVLAVLGINRFNKADRLKIDRYTYKIIENQAGLTETYWPFYAVAGGVGTVLGWIWLLLLGSRGSQMMKVSVYGLTSCLAVMSVLCFWGGQIFWGIVFAVGAFLQFLYVMSVMDRFPFTMLVLQKAVNLVWNLPEVMRIVYAFMVVMLLWMVIWSFGAAGVVASSIGDGGRWWLLVVRWQVLLFNLRLFVDNIHESSENLTEPFATCAVLCNTVHVIVSGMVFLVLIHGGRGAASMPKKPLLKTLQHAITTSLGSICYGSLFTAAIRTLRWEIRGVRSKIGNNECLLCCVDFLFNLVETLVRFFNKYAYVQTSPFQISHQISFLEATAEIEITELYQCCVILMVRGIEQVGDGNGNDEKTSSMRDIAVYGKSFNHSARDAWELFQSTGIEALVAYDCSGAVLLMGTVLGGLITGTCAGIWTWSKSRDSVAMIGSTAMLMGMILVGIAMVVVESAVTSIYIAYAEDPMLINRWDAEFFNQMSEALHQRLQYRSARARQVINPRLQHLGMLNPVSHLNYEYLAAVAWQTDQLADNSGKFQLMIVTRNYPAI
ncbi:hypothetical protein ACLOJK_000801 [Asimina triloba]